MGLFFSIGFCTATNFAYNSTNHERLEIISWVLIAFFALGLVGDICYVYFKNLKELYW